MVVSRLNERLCVICLHPFDEHQILQFITPEYDFNFY